MTENNHNLFANLHFISTYKIINKTYVLSVG